MADDKKYFRMGPWQWVLYALVAALIVASIIRGQSGDARSWEKCKESLFTQMISGECTPRRSFAPQQDNINPTGQSNTGTNV